MAPTTRSTGARCNCEHHHQSEPEHDCQESTEQHQSEPNVVHEIPSQEQNQNLNEEGGIITRLRLRRAEDESLGEMMTMTSTTNATASSSSAMAECSSSSRSKASCGKKGKPINVGHGKENVPPLVMNGHVLVGVDVQGTSDDEDELALRPLSSRTPRPRHAAAMDAQADGMQVDIEASESATSSRATGPRSSDSSKSIRKSRENDIAESSMSARARMKSPAGALGIKTRSGKVAARSLTDKSAEMDVDGPVEDDLEDTDDEGTVVVQNMQASCANLQDDDDVKRRKRRRTEGVPSSSSTPSSGLISSSNLQAIGGGLSLPGPTGNPSSAQRSRFSTGGMRTRSGATITPRDIRTRSSAASHSMTSPLGSSTPLAPSRPGNSRPRTLSQSSSHSSMNGVMMNASAGASTNTTSPTTSSSNSSARLSRSVSYAYGFATGEANGNQQSHSRGHANGGGASERRTLRRSDSSKSSGNGMRRRDRELSVSSMVSVRSESMSGERIFLFVFNCRFNAHSHVENSFQALPFRHLL